MRVQALLILRKHKRACTIAVMDGDTSQPRTQPQPPSSDNSQDSQAAPAPVAAPAAPPQAAVPVDSPTVPPARPPTPEQTAGPAMDTMPGQLSWAASAVGGARSMNWFIGVVVGALLVSAGVYWLTGSIVPAAAIVIVSVLVGIVYTKNPRVLQYAIDEYGITIGQKRYGFDEFRAYAVLDDHGYSSIALMPLQRFLPMLSVYYNPDVQQQVFDALNSHLPLVEYKRDTFDRITTGLHF